MNDIPKKNETKDDAAKGLDASFVNPAQDNAPLSARYEDLRAKEEQLHEALIRNDALYHMIDGYKWSYGISAAGEVVTAEYDDWIVRRCDASSSADTMAWVKLLHPDDRDRVRAEFMAAVRDRSGNTPYETVYRMLIKDGSYIWAKTSGRLIPHADGTAELFGMSIDITAQIEAQQKHLLGAIPISPNILSKENIGMWAFELDEGQPPRMYGDDAMIRLVGLDHQVPPEEMYHAWYDHIDSGSYKLVQDTVAKMMAGEHAEVQYPWHHPDGGTMIVRCGGVRNPEYTKGIRVEGTHQNVSEVLHYDEAEVKRLKNTEIQLQHEQLRSEVLNYMINNEDDPIELLKNYAERLRVLIGCDQVIYRDLEATRIMVNSPAIEKTWSVPIEYCQHCQHFDAHHPMYSGGFTEMEDCQRGWQGIPVYHDCPIKSSLTRIVYQDGEIAGYLAIHYVQNYHHFTDIERKTVEEFTRILSISLSRFKARQENRELKLLQEYQKELQVNTEIISGLASEYLALYYVNMKENYFKIYSVDGKLKDTKQLLTKDTDAFTLIRMFAQSPAVHPEDRVLFADISVANVKNRLNGIKRFSIRFRRDYGQGFLWSVMDVVKYEAADEEANSIAIGFAERDKEIRAENEHQKQLQEAFDEVNEANMRNKLVLSFVKGIKWSYFINDKDEIISAKYGESAVELYDVGHPGNPMAWVELVHPEDRENAVNAFKGTLRDRNGEKLVDMTYRLMGNDGNYHWTKVSGRVFQRENGIRELFGISIDVTEQMDKEREQQQQLHEALSMAQSASRAKTTFLNNMSHDIRTPMNAIIGFTGLAASHIDNKEQVQDYLTKIGQSSDHLLSLINDVLDMSRIESGKMNLEEKEENLPAIIHTLRDIVQADIRTKQHDFFIDTVNVNDENVICDKLRLNQVLLNILSNAIKYTPNGGIVSMRITEKAVKPSGYATYEFCIKDNGMGMDAEFQKTIFDPFTRVKSSTVSGIQGTGLGMAITKNIIDMMGGTIDIQSAPGKGTQMTVTFDFRLVSAPKEAVVISELQGLRGLVVDDDAGTCMSIAGMLRDIGMRDEWCVTGKEAVLRATEAHSIGDSFKVYIIDWLMPDMNGIETTRRIRKVIGDEVPIIILTAYDWSDVEAEAREAGVTAFVSKPIFPSDLHRVLNSCLGKAEETMKAPTDDFDFTGKKILLVEDNALNREISVELLTEYGCVTDTAEDGTIAVEKIKNAKDGDYDVILMDIQMPIMNGYEATKAIRALGTPVSKIPILAMTADAFAEDRRHALHVGMNDHITKPINIKLLRQTLAKYL